MSIQSSSVRVTAPACKPAPRQNASSHSDGQSGGKQAESQSAPKLSLRTRLKALTRWLIPHRKKTAERTAENQASQSPLCLESQAPQEKTPEASSNITQTYRERVPHAVQNAMHELGHAVVGFIGKLPIQGLWLRVEGGGDVKLDKADMDLDSPQVLLPYLVLLMAGYNAELNDQTKQKQEDNEAFRYNARQWSLIDFAQAISLLPKLPRPDDASEGWVSIPVVDAKQVQTLLAQPNWNDAEQSFMAQADMSARQLLDLPLGQSALQTAREIQQMIPETVYQRMVNKLVDVPMTDADQQVGFDEAGLRYFLAYYLDASCQKQMKRRLRAFIQQQTKPSQGETSDGVSASH